MSIESEIIERLGLAEIAKRLGEIDRRLKAVESGFDRPPMYCEVRRTADESINNATHSYLTWQSEIYDPYNMWSSGQWITLPVAGIWLVTACVSWASGSGYRYVGIRNNTTSLFIATHSNNASSTVEYQSVSKVAYLPASTQLGCWVYHNHGSALSVTYNSNYSPIMGVYRLA